MLKQLSNLCLETDGRYATAEELQFMKDYLDSVELRISAYEKVRDNYQDIVEAVEEKKHHLKEDIFHIGDRDVRERMKHDSTRILRCTAGTMLIDDLDRLREGMLIWFQTIARSFGFQRHSGVNFKLYQEVIKNFLTLEEAALIIPIFQLEQTILGS